MERRQRGHCVRHIYALIIFEMGKLFFDGLQTSALKTHPKHNFPRNAYRQIPQEKNAATVPFARVGKPAPKILIVVNAPSRKNKRRLKRVD